MKFYIAFLVLFSSLYTVAQQNVVVYTEHDQDGEIINLNNSEKNRVIDINSILRIDIKTDSIYAQIAKNNDGEIPDALAKKITLLVKVMESRNESLKTIKEIVDRYNYEDFKTNKAGYDKYISDLQTAVFALDEITRIDPRIDDKALEFDDLYGSVYQAAEFVLKETLQEVETFAQDKGVYVQFGSWLISKGKRDAIHLRGFDSIAPKERFEVDRWQVIPTPEQLAELENLKKFAKDNQGKEDEILKEIAKQQLEQLRGFATTELVAAKQKVLGEIQRIKDSVGGAATGVLATVDSEINTIETSFNTLLAELNKRKSYYTGVISGADALNVSQLISTINNDLAFIKSSGQALLDEINTAVTTITNAGLTSLNDLKVFANKLKSEYSEGFNAVKTTITAKLNMFLYGPDVDFAALKFSDEVFKLSINELPSFTELDLADTGVRRKGDQLAFKLVVQSKKGTIYEENRRFFMFQVLTHLEGSVGVIFADPLANTAVQTQFQLAPYYNVLAKGLFDKGARRRSVVYNRLLDWGIGLHVSAPDFDGDDIPELGAGMVISFFADYVQTGAAINVFTGDPYWFFGIRLPVPTFNLGSISNGRD